MALMITAISTKRNSNLRGSRKGTTALAACLEALAFDRKSLEYNQARKQPTVTCRGFHSNQKDRLLTAFSWLLLIIFLAGIVNVDILGQCGRYILWTDLVESSKEEEENGDCKYFQTVILSGTGTFLWAVTALGMHSISTKSSNRFHLNCSILCHNLFKVL